MAILKTLQSVAQTAGQDTNSILFIDEIHTIIGAGRRLAAVDAANLIKPLLSSGKIR